MRYEILVDRRENPRKCTVLPLAHRPDFNIIKFDPQGPLAPLSSPLLLHMDGPPLDELAPLLKHKTEALAVIDCHWRRLPSLLRRLSPPLPPLARIPAGFVTAYPRRNIQGLDPDGGLATIEAMFIAAAFVGVWDETLFSAYHFGAEFLTLNREAFARYGVTAAPTS